jgi:hypothetical protein
VLAVQRDWADWLVIGVQVVSALGVGAAAMFAATAAGANTEAVREMRLEREATAKRELAQRLRAIDATRDRMQGFRPASAASCRRGGCGKPSRGTTSCPRRAGQLACPRGGSARSRGSCPQGGSVLEDPI